MVFLLAPFVHVPRPCSTLVGQALATAANTSCPGVAAAVATSSSVILVLPAMLFTPSEARAERAPDKGASLLGKSYRRNLDARLLARIMGS